VNSIQIPNKSVLKVNSNYEAKVNLTNVSCKLTDNGKDLTELHLASSEIEFNSLKNFSCVLGQLTVKDFIQNSLFFETLDSRLLQLKIEQGNNGREFHCSMNSFKIIMATGLILTLHELYQKSSVKGMLKLRDSPSKQEFSKISVKVENPLFEFRDLSPALNTCDVDFGALEFHKDDERVQVRMKNSAIYTLVLKDYEYVKEFLICDFSLNLQTDMPVVDCVIPSIRVSSSLEQVKFVQQVISDYKEQFSKFEIISKEPQIPLPKQAPSKFSVENMIYGQEEDSELLNIKVLLESASFKWSLQTSSKPKSLIESEVEKVDFNYVKKATSTWIMVKINQLSVESSNHESLKVFFPLCPNFLQVSLQDLPKKQIVDLKLNSSRIIVTPLVVRLADELLQELSQVLPLAKSGKVERCINGEFQDIQLVLTSDTIITQDEEHFQYSDQESKRFILIQMSGEFQGAKVKSEDFFVSLGKSSNFQEEIPGKNLIHPLKFEIIYSDSLHLNCSEINIDFSMSHIHFFKELLNNFSFPSSQSAGSMNPSLEVCKIPLKLKMQQLLLSISHDSSMLASSNSNTFFIIQLDTPSATFHQKISFSTQFAIFYFNQQYMEWEPLLEKSAISLKFSPKEKPKKVEFESTGSFNVNISSALLSCISNFYSGIQDYNLLEISTPTLKATSRIQSGFTIRNETGQRIRYAIDKKSYILANLEENSLEFDEVEEEQQLAPVIMFKTNMKARKAYKAKKVTIKLAERLEITDICIDKLGSKVYSLSNKGSNYQVICEVTSRHGNNILTIKSPIFLKNSLKESIDIRLIFSMSQARSNESQYSNNIPLSPMSQMPLPIDFLGFTEFQLKIKGYSWSQHKSIKITEGTVIECTQVSLNSFDRNSISNRDLHKTASAVLKVLHDEIKDDNEKFIAKVFNFEAPFVIENCLCCDLEYFCIVEGSDIRPKGLLTRGEQFNCLEIHPSSEVSLALRIPGYDKTSFLTIEKETKQIFQFSKKHCEQVNVILESSVREGMFKVVLYSEFWLENHTGMPLLFKYMENNQEYDVISLPFVVEGVHFDGLDRKKKMGTSSMFSVFGEKIEVEEETVKPWMKYSESKKLGLSSLVDDEETHDEGQGTIRMFSSDSANMQKAFVAIKLANSHWSKSFKLATAKAKNELLTSSEQSIKALENCNSKRKCLYEVAMMISIAQQPFSRTKIIRFIPRFVLINKMPNSILISQYPPDDDLGSVCHLVSNERSAFHWPNYQTGRSVCIRIDQYGWKWSGNFNIDFPDDFVIRVINSHSHEETLVHITIALEENTLHVIFQDISHMPPYRVENLSMETLVFSQIDSETTEKILKPFEACGYAWDRPLYKKVLKVSILAADASPALHLGRFKFYKKEESKTIELKAHGSHKAHPLFVDISNSGSTKVLCFRHEQSDEEGVKNERNAVADDLSVVVKLESFAISVINMTPEEIIFASFNELNCQFTRSCNESSCDLHLRTGQIDNQIYRAFHPVLVSMIDKTNRLFSLEFKKRHSLVKPKQYSTHEVDYFKYFKLKIAPLDIKVDGWILESAFDFITTANELLSPVIKI
jgi:hypothetical protein